jgi:hypothetical protein
MKDSWLALICTVVLVSFASLSFAQTNQAMVVAVSRIDAIFGGGIGVGGVEQPGQINVEILAYVSADGQWKSHPCAQNYSKACEKFAHDYLGKAHNYTVISPDGNGADVISKPTTLSECFDYTTTGSYTGAEIRATAIATDSPDLFSSGPAATHLPGPEAQVVKRLLKPFIPARLDSIEKLNMYRIQLEGRAFVVIQRAYQDFAQDSNSDTGPEALKFIFGVAVLDNGRLQIVHWKKNIEDENEQVLATIHLKSGRDFLVTTVSDPESQTFHVYGIRDGKLALVYSGGGSSC